MGEVTRRVADETSTRLLALYDQECQWMAAGLASPHCPQYVG
jgi:hypothetical protein